jgi:hypothetical protein
VRLEHLIHVMAMLETELESILKDEVARRHGLCLKLVSPGVRGFPDRLVAFKIKKGQCKGQAHVMFLEMKTDDGEVSELQSSMHDKMLSIGMDVRVVIGLKGVAAFIAFIDKFVI